MLLHVIPIMSLSANVVILRYIVRLVLARSVGPRNGWILERRYTSYPVCRSLFRMGSVFWDRLVCRRYGCAACECSCRF